MRIVGRLEEYQYLGGKTVAVRKKRKTSENDVGYQPVY